MIDSEKCKNEFDKYVEQFDLNNELIIKKKIHTYKVVEYMERIAKEENLNEYDFNLARVCALLHDIGRFEQAKKYNTYQDSISVDHGNLGCDILQKDNYISNYLTNEEDKNICLKAVKNHNKFEMEEISERERFFTKLVKDSDKLDIMISQYNLIQDGKADIYPEILEAFRNHKLYNSMNDKSKRSDASIIVTELCFIYDIYFNSSLRIIKDSEIIGKKINILRDVIEEKIVNEIEETINSYVNTRI